MFGAARIFVTMNEPPIFTEYAYYTVRRLGLPAALLRWARVHFTSSAMSLHLAANLQKINDECAQHNINTTFDELNSFKKVRCLRC